MIISSAFKVIDYARYLQVTGESASLYDNRFAVINGLMFDLVEVESKAHGFSYIVCVYSAEDVFNPSHAEEQALSYAQEYFVVGFELGLPYDVEPYKYTQAESMTAALFTSLIGGALAEPGLIDQLSKLAKGAAQ